MDRYVSIGEASEALGCARCAAAVGARMDVPGMRPDPRSRRERGDQPEEPGREFRSISLWRGRLWRAPQEAVIQRKAAYRQLWLSLDER